MVDVNIEELVVAAKRIIDEGDLCTLTFSTIYDLLEKQFTRDLSEHKKVLRKKVKELVQQKEVDGHGTTKEEAKETPALASESPADVAKIEENKQCASNEQENGKKEVMESEKIEFDRSEDGDINIESVSASKRREQLMLLEAAKYGAPAARTRSGGRKSPSKPSPKKKSKKSRDDDEDDEDESDSGEDDKGSDDDEVPDNKQEAKSKKRKATGLTKPSILSDALASFLGESRLPRTEVVKRLHGYIKEHNLQNPQNKRKIIFDEKLREVFKCKTTDYFKMNKLISKHVKPADEVM